MGKIADLSARKLTEDGVGKMSCLAGIGGRVKPLMEIAQAAQAILAIDGCPLHCGRNTLEQAGFTKFEHLCLADIGMAKGKTPVTDEAVAKVAEQGKPSCPSSLDAAWSGRTRRSWSWSWLCPRRRSLGEVHTVLADAGSLWYLLR